MSNQIIGFIFVYSIIIYLVPHILYKYAPFTRFITYIANVDLIANVLATNYPDYFKLVYNIDPKSIIGYVSFNIISLIALSGIFLYGLQLKLIGYTNNTTFRSMIMVAIITYTLPTMLIPYLTKYVNKFSKHIALHYIEGSHLTKSEKTKDIELTKVTIKNISIIVSSVIALAFIFLEGYVIENLIHKHHYSNKGKRVFGYRHDNPLENLFN
tara:strand:+ start:7423 stop:8058 length:636 start_codon:yes stop_codon:yes gene_type:complete